MEVIATRNTQHQSQFAAQMVAAAISIIQQLDVHTLMLEKNVNKTAATNTMKVKRIEDQQQLLKVRDKLKKMVPLTGMIRLIKFQRK
jgi:precorrin-6x reductase